MKTTATLILWAAILAAMPATAHAQFNTPALDGVITAGEYGAHVNGQNQQFEGGTTWYMAWDANNLYLATTGSNFNEAAVLYLDRNPIVPVNGGTNANGSLQGYYTYDRNHMMQPFRADFVLYFKNGYHEFRHADGAGYWGGQTSNTLAVATNGFTNTVEIAIPWNTVTQGAGRPAAFNWFAYKTYDYGPGTNGVYHSVPVGNLNCACNQDPSRLYPTRYYNVLNTANGTSTRPFSTVSFTYYEDYSVPGTGGYYLANSTFYDLTINDNSATNTDNDPGNRQPDNLDISNRVLVEGTITITHDLYVGRGSALLPHNTGGTVTANVIFSGLSGSLYNYGRIDANPEANNPGDWNTRRINVQFTGITQIRPTNLFKDNYRLSNITVSPGASLLGPSTDSASIELQWGTFNNQGTVNLGNGLSGFCDLGLRGDWTQHNDYYLSGGGTWLLHGLLIGRNSSRLQPGSGVVNLRIQGDFENYDEFSAKSGANLINITMGGRKRQYFKGNTTETTGAATTFHNLTIDNADLLGAWNNAADVWFESYGGGTIQYFLTGALTMQNGDLVTRHRSTNVVHNLTLRDTATTVVTLVHSNLSTLGSSFVDGPLRYEVERSTSTDRDFPIGKTKTEFGYAIGDARPIRLTLDHDAVTKTLYTAEMFLDDRSTFYTWPLPVPEVISWISQQRYWNVTKGAGANVQSAVITLSYDVEDRTDGVTNAPALRIVKDDGAGNWVNIAPFGGPLGGGTGAGTGVIMSNPFLSFSDFTLASVDGAMPLPVDLLSFDAQPGPGHVVLDWATTRESNSSHFILERADSLGTFSPLAQIPAAGTSSSLLRYQHIDRALDPGATHYRYRLRMVDADGSYRYSEVRTVFLAGGERPAISIWPNPSDGHMSLWLSGTADAGDCQLRLWDLRGALILNQALDGAQPLHELALDGLPAGTYILELQSGQHRVHEKVIVR